MRKLLLLLALCAFLYCGAQDESVKNLQKESSKTIPKDPADTIPKIWKLGGLYSLTVTQGSLSNWAAGGEEFSFSINSMLSVFAYYKKNRHSWDNTFDFNLGYVNTTSLGGRKNDDRFDLVSKYGYALKPKINLSALFNVRSQFFNGYTFDADDVKTYTSTFMAPGYLLLSAGIDFKPATDLSIFISPATARWVIVKDTVLANQGLYGVEPGETSNFEFGAFLTVNYFKEFNKNLTYKVRLDLFSNYLHNPQNIDLFMTNLLSVKISNWLSATWGVDFIYDDDVRLFGKNERSAALQVKSLVGIGLQLKF